MTGAGDDDTAHSPRAWAPVSVSVETDETVPAPEGDGKPALELRPVDPASYLAMRANRVDQTRALYARC